MLSDLSQSPLRIHTVSLGRAPVALYAMPVSAGHEIVRSRTYDWRGLERGASPFALIQHTIAGTGQLRFHGKEFSLGPGDTMILTFPDDNRYWLPPRAEWHFFWICLNGREALRVMGEIIRERGPVLRLPDRAVDQLARLCLDLLDGSQETPLSASSATYDGVMALALVLQDKRPRKDAAVSDGIAAAEAHITANLEKPLTVEQLARIAGYSRFHFCRVFRDMQGLSPAAYIQRARLDHAARMLDGGKASIKQISHACGYADPNYFAKCFRKRYGVSPTAFLRSGPTERGIILQR